MAQADMKAKMHSSTRLLEEINQSFRQENFSREPRNLYDPVAYMISLGGKRMRPVLLLMSCEMLGGDIRKAMPAAMGIEMFHNFSLVHDDIMDQAALRRGKATVHVKWNPDTAILAGDTMLTLAFEYFLRLDESLIRPCLEVFGQTSREVCDGQQFDMDYEKSSSVTVAQYMAMIRLKTAVLLGASLKIGAIIAGASDWDQEAAYDAGIHYGLSFQLRDDLLDVFGDTKVFGKHAFGDIINNKKTFLWLKAMELADPADRQTLVALSAGKQGAPELKISKTLEIYQKTHAREHAEKLILHHGQEAEKALSRINAEKERITCLVDYMAGLSARNH